MLVEEVEPAGEKDIEWNAVGTDGSLLPSGIYFVRMEAASIANPHRVFTATRKIVLMK